jgi:hypothetical protein
LSCCAPSSQVAVDQEEDVGREGGREGKRGRGMEEYHTLEAEEEERKERKGEGADRMEEEGTHTKKMIN